MKDQSSEKFPPHLKYNLFTSAAFINMKPASRMVLILFYFEINYHKAGRKGKFYAVNFNRIILPYKEIRDRLGYTDKTIWTAIKDIMAHGFLAVSSYGGRSRGDFTVYSIQDRWKEWASGQIIFRLHTGRKIGFQKRGLPCKEYISAVPQESRKNAPPLYCRKVDHLP